MNDFIKEKIVMDGLPSDDVLLIPAYSEVLPKEVSLKTKFSRNIELNVPFVTAAMDTVTEAKMAIAIAREGGIGVIHKNMSIEDQAHQVAIVKRAENGMIYDPITIQASSSVKDALDIMAEYHIGGIPVVDDCKKLVGIVTNRDLRFETNMQRPICEVMTPAENLVITNQKTDMEAAAKILRENKIEKLPVVDNDGKLVGLITYKDITKAKDKPMACKDSKGRLRVAAGVGVTFDTLDRMRALVEAGADAIVIDTAHGHSKGVIEKLKEAKREFPNIDIVVGNVATGEAAKMLVEAGAATADLVIAATDSDEVNMICCLLAKKLGASHTIARVRKPELADEIDVFSEDMGLSMTINPELYAAQEIFSVLRFPGLMSVEPFRHGLFEIVEFRLTKDGPATSMTLQDLGVKYNSRALVCAIRRNGTTKDFFNLLVICFCQAVAEIQRCGSL